MDRYKIIKEVGDGTFGIVWQALNKRSGEVVAIKKMKRKYYSWEECINLREVKDCSLYHLMKDKGNPFSEIEIRNWCFQVFQGLVYMHQHGYFHRDLKPENLLVSKGLIKIADFGLACEITSQPPYTEYVSTRWYRAPEVLLQSPKYGSEVDLWAMGAIMAELFTLRPLFPGSSEADEIYKICSVIGSPTKSTWCVGLELSSKINYQFPEHAGVDLAALLPSASKEAVNLIAALCSWDPCKRPTAVEALQHPFFQNCYNYIPPSLRLKPATSKMSPSAGLNDSRRAMNQKYAMGYSGVLPHVKPAGNITSSVKLPASLNTGGGHHKLEMNHQGGVKYGERQPKYQPAVKCNTTGKGKGEGVWDTAGKLAHMNIGSAGRPPNRNQHVYIPPPAKAKQRKPCDGSRPYCSKVAG